MTFIDIAKDKPQRHRDTERTQSRPPTSQPRRHKDTKTSQSSLDRPARSRPPGGRGPLGAGAASDASARSCTHSQRPALSESAGLASRVDQSSTFEQARPRRDRRALRVGRGEVRLGRMLAFGADGLRHRVPAIIGSPALPPLHSGQPRRRRFRSFVFFVSSWLRWSLLSVSSVPLWFIRCDVRIHVQCHDSGKKRGPSAVQS